MENGLKDKLLNKLLNFDSPKQDLIAENLLARLTRLTLFRSVGASKVRLHFGFRTGGATHRTID